LDKSDHAFSGTRQLFGLKTFAERDSRYVENGTAIAGRQPVMDGDLDGFIKAYLMSMKEEEGQAK